MVAQPKTPYIPPQAYLEWEETQEERHEYHDGVIVAMSGGSRNHSVISNSLASSLTVQLKTRQCETHGGGLKVCVKARNRYFYPDVAIVCGSPSFTDGRKDTIDNPVVVIEVLSESTERFDWTTKSDSYLDLASVQTYMLVSQDEARIERRRKLPDKHSWEITVYKGIDAVVPLPEIECELRSSEVYERIEFAPVADFGIDPENLAQ